MFVLAHLSDPHLASQMRPKLGELVGKRAIGFFNWHRRRRLLHRAEVLTALLADLRAQSTDHVAVTGDLINIALPGEFLAAREWLQALGPPTDVTLVPGNHDSYARATAGHALQIWGPYMRAEGAEAAFPFLRRRGQVALIGLSSAVPTAPFMATGYLGEAQLARFSELLKEASKEGLFRVVLMHHPPVTVPGRRFKRLLDGRAFRAALAEHGAELVLHGHDHVHAVVLLQGPDGPIPALGVPSASAAPDGNEQPAAYNLYEIEGKPGAWRCELARRGFERGATTITELGRQTLIG